MPAIQQRRAIRPGANNKVPACRCCSTINLAIRVVAKLELQACIVGPLEELIAATRVMHTHPEVKSSSLADIEITTAECRKIVEAIEFKGSAELPLPWSKYRAKFRGHHTCGGQIKLNAVLVVDSNITRSLIEVPV